MNHDQATTLLGTYLDNELDLTTSLSLESHLADCPICQEKLAREKELVAVLQEKAPVHRPSPYLKTRILAAIREKERPVEMIPWWKQFSLGWSLSGGAIGATAALVLSGILVPQSSTPILVENAIADHVRSLQVNHLMDVASTDQHTVKPWFAGKVDYSPQVIDLTPSGYPLVGGRLDILDGHEVAAIVYQRRKHFINLFVWPSRQEPISRREFQQDGYRVLSWTRSGMNYLAVSELGDKELHDFAQLIQDQTLDSRSGE